jgi:hypothetical protein
LRRFGVREDHQPSRKQQLHSRHYEEEGEGDELQEVLSNLSHPALVSVLAQVVLVSSFRLDRLSSPFDVTTEIFKALYNMTDFMLDMKPVVLTPSKESIEQIFIPLSIASYSEDHDVLLASGDVLQERKGVFTDVLRLGKSTSQERAIRIWPSEWLKLRLVGIFRFDQGLTFISRVFLSESN